MASQLVIGQLVNWSICEGWEAKVPEGLEALGAWQQAHEFMLYIHCEVVPCLPLEEKWGLADQIRRSSKSIAANIAEGYGRFYYQDNVRFCYNGRGSLLETINHLIAARDLGYISSDLYEQARQHSDAAHRILNGYIGWLKKSRQGASEPGQYGQNIFCPDQSPIDQLTN